MGAILEARCRCGYHEARLFCGGGENDFLTRCGLPATCGRCRRVRVVNAFAKRKRCGSCGGPVSFVAELTAATTAPTVEADDVFEWNARGQMVRIPPRGHLCPRCNEATLELIDMGCFD